MREVELRLLGNPQVFVDGREGNFRTRKALALLVFLAAEGGMHRRDKLAELLWPTSTSDGGKTALRSALARIRWGLGERDAGSGEGLLKIEGDLLGVEESELWLDLAVLREASAAARASRLGEGNNEDLISTLRSADVAYRGEFLEDFRFEDAPEFNLWVEAQRSLWRARVGEVLGRLADLEAETGELAAAAGTAVRWVALDPTEEAARVRLMEARSAAGDRNGALAAYEEYRSEFRRLGLDPGPGIETLNARIRSQAVRTEAGRLGPGSFRMPFVGRQAEFEALVEEYRAARSGAVRSVIVVGEAGIGKTRLAEEFLAWADSRGADTLRGRTFKTEVPLPYETLVDALRPRLERERAPDDLLDDPWLAELSRILPELRVRYPDLPAPTADTASARALLLEAVARLGAALAGGPLRRSGAEAGGTGEPLVVFVDDLQWADGATFDALGYACRSWARGGVPLLLLTTVREEDLRTANLSGWLSSLERELPAKRLPLAPMGERDIYGFLRPIARITGADDGARQEDLKRVGRWLREESDGHPLFLVQILGLLLERGVLVEHAGQGGRREIVLSGEGFDERELRGLMPSRLRELVLDKLRPLPADAKDVLTAGAVLGRGFGFGALLRVARVGEAEGLAALDGLVSARLLEETGPPSGGAYSFAHEKIREVAYTDAGEARREGFHRRALEALEERNSSAAELARHALGAKVWERAFRHLLEAAEDAMDVFAARNAVGYYERARDLLEDRPREKLAAEDGVSERLRLYGGLARAHALVYDWVRAQEAYEQMLDLAREAEDREAEWAALHGLGAQAIGLAVEPEDAEMLRVLTRREGPGEDAPTAGTAEGRSEPERSQAFLIPRTARRYAEKALRLAEDLGRADLVLRSRFGLGVAYTWEGRWEDAAAQVEETLSLLAATSGGETEERDAQLAWARGVVAISGALTDGPDDAFGPTGALQSNMRETAEMWDALDTDYARAQQGGGTLGISAVGEYEEAIHKGSKGLEAARSLGHPHLAYLSLYGMGDAYRRALSLANARSAYSEIFDWVSSPTPFGGQAHAGLCAVAALSGDWEPAHGHALKASGLTEDHALPWTHVHRHHEIEALLLGGDADLAREILRDFERRTRGQNGYFRLAYLRSAAVIARWDGDAKGTMSLLVKALGEAKRLGLLEETWQISASLGEAHEERGETGPSEEAFGRAAVVIRQLADKMSDGGLREGFLAAPQTRRVLKKAQDGTVDPGSSIP